MTDLLAFALLCSLATLSACSPLGHVRARQLQIAWVTDSTTVLDETTVTEIQTSTVDASTGSTADGNTAAVTPFLMQPPPNPVIPSSLDSMSASVVTDTEIVSTILTSIVSASPVTVTLSASPTTITATVTVSDVSNPSTWAAPAQFTDLNSFKVMHFACGQDNLQIVGNVPPDEPDVNLAVNLGAIAAALNSSLPDGAPLNASSAVLQLYYPTNSINPESSPQGGADFYATPLDLSSASNVTMEYSVYFPVDFQWALGGKLPGLYGGHMTCSGGDDAKSCFSTRMMWRADGAGELYLVCKSNIGIPSELSHVLSTHPRTSKPIPFVTHLLSQCAMLLTVSQLGGAPSTSRREVGQMSDKLSFLTHLANRMVGSGWR